MKTPGRRVMAILWPAFLMAAVLEIAVFALVDPASLHWLSGAPIEVSATTVYSLSFFAFWALIAAACTMTERLAESDVEVNSRSFR